MQKLQSHSDFKLLYQRVGLTIIFLVKYSFKYIRLSLRVKSRKDFSFNYSVVLTYD